MLFGLESGRSGLTVYFLVFFGWDWHWTKTHRPDFPDIPRRAMLVMDFWFTGNAQFPGFFFFFLFGHFFTHLYFHDVDSATVLYSPVDQDYLFKLLFLVSVEE